MKALSFELEPYQQQTLKWMRDRHPVAYLRERAAALLKLAAGEKVEDVADHGLLKRRKADTVRGWVKAYQRYGLGALYQQPRRRRVFSPGAKDSVVGSATSSSPATGIAHQPVELSTDPEDVHLVEPV